MAEHVVEAGLTLMPMIGKAKMLRSWGGIMDMSPDGSPIIDKTHIEGLYLNCGWCYGGFKAVPGSGNCLRPSHRHRPPARGRHALPARPLRHGRGLMDEEATGSQHNLH
jgi:glycine/D-amino acid oxidase-like deaminating enzyme